MRDEILHARQLPARCLGLEPLDVGGCVAPHIDRRRRSLEHVEVTGVLRQRGDALDPRRPGADDADLLVTQVDHLLARGAARVAVVPATRVEAVAGEGLDAGDARQLRLPVVAGGHDHEPGPQLVAAVGLEDPPGGSIIELRLGDTRVKQRPAVQVEGAAEGLAVGENLWLEHVLHRGDGSDLLKERQVDVRLHVARGAGVAVPVPGAPEVTAPLEHEEVVDAGLGQPRRGEHPGEPAPDDHDVGLDPHRGPILDGVIRVLCVALQVAGQRPELRQALGPHGPPLVALFVVLPLERHRVEVEAVGIRRFRHRSPAAVGHMIALSSRAGPCGPGGARARRRRSRPSSPCRGGRGATCLPCCRA